jgi:biopolymer transport protein ExbB/TolQ
MDAYHILVIILSVFLALFLLLSIIFVAYLIKVVKAIQQITEKAASIVDTAANIKKFVSPAVVSKLVFEAVNKAVKHHNKKGE